MGKAEPRGAWRGGRIFPWLVKEERNWLPLRAAVMAARLVLDVSRALVLREGKRQTGEKGCV